MITLLSEIHFWTTLEDVVIKHTDCGTFKYYNKKDVDDTLYAQSKKQYCQQRGLIWTPLNKRPQKLRDRLKELEEYLVHNRIVYLSLDENRLKLLLSTGLLITLTISKTGDLTNILFDKQLSTKLQVNIICDGTLLGNQVICIGNDGHVFGFGGAWKEGWVLEGGPRRRLNYHGEWLAVWGKAGAEHPQPWSPLAKDHQRANLHLYWIGSGDPELLAYKKTDGEPLQVVVSKTSSRTLIVVEQRVTQRGAVSVEVSNLELVGNILKRVSVTSVPLQTQVSCTALSDSEDRLLICCIDGALALLDRKRGSTRTVKAAFIPTLAAWHPDGAIVAVSNERGQLQYYDTALSCVKSQLVGEDCTPTAIIDFSSYFNVQFSIASVSWGPKELIFSLEQGPLVLVRHVGKPMTFRHLMQRYLILNKVDKAIKLLLSWEFNEASFFGLQRIVAHLMRRPLTEDVAQHLQNALGSFHNSPVPLNSQIRHRYGNQVISLTRRFFHQLVRAEMFETAFLLAVDVAHHDLFMDLHYVAVRIGETEMAAAARAQASALLSQYSSEASDCSRSSCSQCSDTDSSSSEEYDASITKADEPKATISKSGFVRQPDNCLTTDFNQSQPTTYKAISQNGDYHRPRATFVKSPQVPSDFIRKSSTVMTPPLPFTPPLPNLSNTSLGIPYLSGNHFKPPGYQYSPMSSTTYGSNIFSSSNMSGGIFMSNSNNSKLLQNSVAYTAFSSSNLRVDNAKKTYATINKVQVPPLPNVSLETVTENAATSTAKKHQPKVKFSDTVTAFIVPEIKRPQRPPPPSHVTNPQKELADSLPLCHPNEDYLKDFAPVRRDDSNEESDNGQPPKIKVVHFGVV